MALNRTLSFNSLLFGHIANYQSRGSFNAPEQLGYEAADDGYRALLNPGTGETDIDTCVPSTTLAAMMVRWMLVFEDRDADTVWVLKTAPRRFYPGANTTSGEGSPGQQPHGSFLSVRRASTRFGWISFTVDADTGSTSTNLGTTSHGSSVQSTTPLRLATPLRLVANVTLVLHGQ